MRILMFCSYFPPQYSGAAKQALSLAKQLEQYGHHIEFLTMRDIGEKKEDWQDGFKVHRIDVNQRRNQELPFWLNFFQFVWSNRSKFDVLHSHGAHYINSIVGPSAKLAGLKSIVKATMYENDLKGIKQTRTGYLHYFFLRSVNSYIAISKDLIKEFQSKGLDKQKIQYIPNGVDTKKFSPPSQGEKIQLRHKLNLPEDKVIFLSVGVFDKRKNIGWLIEEWDKNNGFGYNNYLVTVGPQSREDTKGEFLDKLRQIAVHQKTRIKLMGHVENINDYYKAADVFILPSTNEGLPNVVLEAMSSGLPCIATRTSGTSDLIKEGNTGMLFHANDVTEFSEKISKISPTQVKYMGGFARKFILKEFSIEAVAQRYNYLYQALMYV